MREQEATVERDSDSRTPWWYSTVRYMPARKLLRATRGGGGEERGRKGEAVAKHRELGKKEEKTSTMVVVC